MRGCQDCNCIAGLMVAYDCDIIQMKVKFLIDRKKKRVIFAEAESDFVDILFSFLTLRLGSIVKILNKQSGLGSLDNLYKSVEQLDDKYLQNQGCKDMLLNPRSSIAELLENLKIENIHDQYPRAFYICSSKDCSISSICHYSYTRTCLCPHCGKLMDQPLEWRKETSSDEGVFVVNCKGDGFIITDDLRVMPCSFKAGISILKELQIEDQSDLEEKVVDFGIKEALILLKSSLVTKNALTMVCFPRSRTKEIADFSVLIKNGMDVGKPENDSMINITLYQEKNNVMCAEVKEDFVNQLFSFLTFPLGFVLGSHCNQALQSGCIKNLYSSADSMPLEFFKSKEIKEMLINPNLPTFYGIKNQMIDLKEAKLKKIDRFGGCASCFIDNGFMHGTSPCKHGISGVEYVEQDPKLVQGVEVSGFVTDSRSYMVTDCLHISPLSVVSAISNGVNFSSPNLMIEKVSIDKSKAQSLLDAMLTSKRALTDAFYPK